MLKESIEEMHGIISKFYSVEYVRIHANFFLIQFLDGESKVFSYVNTEKALEWLEQYHAKYKY